MDNQVLPGILPQQPTRQQIIKQLGWDSLLSLVDPGRSRGAEAEALHAAMLVEVQQATPPAIERLSQNNLKDKLARWLFHQLVVFLPGKETFDHWLKAELAATSGDERAAVEVEANLVRMLIHDEELPAGSGATGGELLVRQLTVAGRGNWQELIKLLEPSVSGGLVHAHIAGDRLGTRAQQVKLLQGASDEVPLFAVEQLLERTFEGARGATGSGSELERVLERRRVLLSEAGLEVEAEATAIFLASRTGQLVGEAPTFDDDQAAAAYRHLRALLARQEAVSKPGELAERYAAEAEQASGALAEVLSLRAAELMMAGDEWQRALDLLPSGVEGALGVLAARYRAVCQARLRLWAEVGETFIELSGERVDRDQALLISLLLGAKQPDSAPRLLGQVANAVQEMRGPAASRMWSLLLALARRCRDNDLMARVWTSMAEKDTDSKRRGLAAFCSGVRQLDAQRHDDALSSFEHARRRLGEHAEAIIGQILAAVGASKVEAAGTAAQLLSQLASKARSEGRARLLGMAVDLYWSAGDLKQAATLSDKMTAENPTDVEALKRGAAIHLRLDNVRQAAQSLERAATHSQGESLFCAVGDLLWQRLDELPGAEKAYRRVLELNPLHPGALSGMRAMFAKADRWEPLLEVLDSLLQLADSDDSRLKLHFDSLSAARRLLGRGDGKAAGRRVLTHADEVLKLESSNSRAIDSLTHLAGKFGWWHELVNRRELLSSSVAGLRGLRRAAQQSSNHELLADACGQLAERSSDDREACAAAIEAGDIYAEHLDDRGRAKGCYRKAVELERSNGQPLLRLADLLRADQENGIGLQAATELAPVLEALLPLSTPAEQQPIRLELGKLYAEQLSQPDEAIKHFRKVLAEDPGDLEALRAYEAALKQAGNTGERVRVLERILQECQDQGEVLQILLDLADCYRERKDNRGLATLALQLQSYADDERALSCLERILVDQGRYRELCEFYERRVQVLVAAGDNPAAADLLARKGNIELSHLQVVSEAMETFTHLLRLRPGDETTLGRLEEILTQLGDWQRLVPLFETFAESLEDDRERVSHLHRAAEIAQNRLKDEAETVRLYERIYQLAPSDSRAFAVLQKKLERENDHRKLVDLLLEQANMITERGEKLDLVLRAAAISEKTDIDLSIDLYNRALKVDAVNAEALESLARIYESLERWDELLQVTKSQIQLGGKPARVALLYFKMGSVIETQHHDDDEAFRYYTESLRQSKSCLPALHGLRDLHTRRSEWQKVAQTLEAEAAVWSESKGKADVLAQAAEVYATKLGDRATALKRYEQAIRIHRECMPAALALFEHYASQGRYADAAAWGKVYARRGRATQAQRARFLIRWAEVLTKLDKPNDAAEALVKALRLRPGDSAALHGLLDLCRQHPDAYDFTSAFRELLKEANKREDPEGRSILSATAGVLAEHRGEVDEALSLYRAAVKMSGPQLRIVVPLADLLVSIGEEAAGRELVEQCLVDDADFNQWLDATLWLARHWGEHCQEYERSIKSYQEALKRQPNLDDVRVEMARMLIMAGEPQRALEELTSACNQLASRATGDLVQLAKRYHSAGLAALAAGNLKAAESNLRRACEYAPEWPYPYLALSKRLLASGDADNAERELKLAEQGLKVRSADVMRAQAEFFGRRGFIDRAVTLYRKAVKLKDPDIDDRMNLAGFLLRGENPAEAFDLLYGAIADRGEYVPAYEQLARGYKILGLEHRVRRAAQVVQLALGGHVAATDPPAPLAAIKADAWKALGAPLAESPLDQIWKLIGAQVCKLFLPEIQTSPASRSELQSLTSEMCRLASVEIGAAVATELPVPIGVVSSSIVTSPTTENLPVPELRAQMVMATTALKLGYGELVNHSPSVRRAVREFIAMLLLPEDLRPEPAKEFLAGVSGRTKRALTKLLVQHATSQKKAERTIQSWFSAIDDACWRVGLLVTEDLGAVARGLALREGVLVEVAYQGGLLHAMPVMERLASYYVSDAFDRERARLQS